MVNNAFIGLNYLLTGFNLITKPGLKRFVIVPLIINIIFFIGLFFLLRHYMGAFNQWFEGLLPSWLQWLGMILWLLFFASFFLAFISTFVTFANIISAPFNSFLAEKVELYLTGTLPEERSLWQNIKDVPRVIGRQLAILLYFVPRALLLLILFFIPVVQAFAPLIWFLFNAWFMTLTYLDYPTDNHRVPFNKVRLLLAQRRATGLGFGIGALIAAMTPGVNCLAIPASVAGATKFWVEDFQKKNN